MHNKFYKHLFTLHDGRPEYKMMKHDNKNNLESIDSFQNYENTENCMNYENTKNPRNYENPKNYENHNKTKNITINFGRGDNDFGDCSTRN